MVLRASSPLIIILLWFAGLGAAAQFGKISVLFEQLGVHYAGQSAVAMGLIVSIVGVVGLVFGTTAGLVIARIGPRLAIVTALVMGAAMSLFQALWLPYPLMILTRVVEGVSHLAIVVVGPTMIAGLASERYRGLAMTLWSSFFGVTYAALALLAPWVIVRFGESGVFVGHAGFMAVVGVGLALILPPDPKADGVARKGGLWAQHVEIYASPRLSAPAMGFFCYTFLYVAVLTLLPPEIPVAQRALAAAGMPLMSIAVSLTLGVWLLGRMRAVNLVQWGYAVSAPAFVLLAIGWGDGWLMTLAGFWLSSALGLVQGASFASIPELNASGDDRARAAGAIAQLGNLGTTTGTPVLAAVLAAAGPWGMAGVAVAAAVLGIGLHAMQAQRRQARST